MMLELHPDTLSTYFLTIRPDAWFAKIGRYSYRRNGTLYDRYEVARQKILTAGYKQASNVRYEIPGRGGYEQKVLHWRGVPLLGIGAGAQTYTNTVDYLIGGSDTPALSQTLDYILAANAGQLSVTSGFEYDPEERVRKRLALDLYDLRLSDFVMYDAETNAEWYEPILSAAVELKLISRDKDRISLTYDGLKYRDILSWMFFSQRILELDREFYGQIHRANVRARVGGEPGDNWPTASVV
jgi:oxygen-independent coproporphyrinogen-3 oxidase